MFKIVSSIATHYQVALEHLEAARLVLRQPQAMLDLLETISPLSKENLSDPNIFYTYPTAYIQWSMCMQGLADWETVPILSYADYISPDRYRRAQNWRALETLPIPKKILPRYFLPSALKA